MAEYINRERARFEAKRYFKNMYEIQEDLDMLFCMLPAENVAPVRHGRWKAYSDCGVTRCSVCDWSIEECIDYKFCPNCGCRMDGGAD